MDTTKELLGRKIRQLRKEKGWTQEYLSEKLGINPKSVLRIENGTTFPTVENLEKIAQAFDTSLSDLFNNNSLADTKYLKENILKTIETLSDTKLRVLYNFLYAIK